MLKPRISYSHALREISVNRSNPCELIRELISNSYDADAKTIKIFPVIDSDHLIYFDDGEGLSDSEKKGKDKITPLEAFFSIGASTKEKGSSQIGYKCQGSKLCFASQRVAIITRCRGQRSWRYISVDNPRDNLSEKIEIIQKKITTPWVEFEKLLPESSDLIAQAIKQFDEEFFK